LWDVSTDGSSPDPDGNGEVLTDEDVPTVTTLTENGDMGLAKRVVSASLDNNGCTELVYEFNLENLGHLQQA